MRMHRKAEQDKIDAARAKRRAVQEAAGLIKKKKAAGRGMKKQEIGHGTH